VDELYFDPYLVMVQFDLVDVYVLKQLDK
jgi:hypothetical protein